MVRLPFSATEEGVAAVSAVLPMLVLRRAGSINNGDDVHQ
jgi:hypothetical protein